MRFDVFYFIYLWLFLTVFLKIGITEPSVVTLYFLTCWKWFHLPFTPSTICQCLKVGEASTLFSWKNQRPHQYKLLNLRLILNRCHAIQKKIWTAEAIFFRDGKILTIQFRHLLSVTAVTAFLGFFFLHYIVFFETTFCHIDRYLKGHILLY